MRLTSRRRDEGGASALELAFLAPGILLLIFFSVQAALYFYGRNVAIQAAREGVSQLRLAQDGPGYEAIRERSINQTERYADALGRGGLNAAKAVPGPAPDYTSPFPRASMTVSGSTITLVPGINLRVHESASGPVETFRGDQTP